MHIIQRTNMSTPIIQELIDSSSDNSLHITSQNGLYHVNCMQIKQLLSTNCTPHANTSYFTVKLDNNQQRMAFWREIFNGNSKSDIIGIIENNILDGLPTWLTTDFVHKYFDDCDAASKESTIRQKSIPRVSSTKYSVGEKLCGDVVYWPKKHADLFHTQYTILFTDYESDKSWAFNTNTLDDLESYTMKMIKIYHAKHPNKLRVLELDAAFMTESLRQQILDLHIEHNHMESEGRRTMTEDIELYQPAPYEHAQSGKSESTIKAIRQIVLFKINNAKVNSPLLQQDKLAEKLFPYAVLDTLSMRNDLASRRNPTQSRSVRWGDSKRNVINQPALVFGTAVTAHYALSIQRAEGKLSPRGYSAIYVGHPPSKVKGGILLLRLDNLSAGPSIKRTFIVQGMQPRLPDSWRDGIDILLQEDSLTHDYYYDPQTNEVYQIRHTSDTLNTVDVEPIMDNSDITTNSSLPSQVDSNIIPPISFVKPNPTLIPTISLETSIPKTGVSHDNNHDNTTSDIAYTYKTVLKTDVPKNKHHYWKKLDMQFVDSSTQEHFLIEDIVARTDIQTGPGSKTLYYQLLDISTETYEYMSCAECISSRETIWDDDTNNTRIAAGQIHAAYVADNYDEVNTIFPHYFDTQSRHNVPYAYQVTMDSIDSANAYKALLLEDSEQYELKPGMSLHQRTALEMAKAFRTSVDDLPVPRKFASCLTHPESFGHLKSLDTELSALRNTDNLFVPEDMNIKDIPPSAILQFIPIWQKKYVGLNFDKFKCRMILLGNKWKNLYHEETYSGMTGMDTMKLVLSLAATRQMDMVHLDIPTAFLTTTVNKQRPKRTPGDPDMPDQTYWARRPPGMSDAQMPYIVKPKGFIYGHPLAARALRLDIHDMLISLDFIPTEYDSTVYTRTEGNQFAILCVAVDDMPLFSTSVSFRDLILTGVRRTYPNITITDPMSTILGIELDNLPSNYIRLRQRGHAINMFKKWMPTWDDLDINTLPIHPMRTNAELPTNDMIRLSNILLTPSEVTEYEQLLGDVQWMLHTEPAATFATRDLSKRKANACDRWELDRLLLYYIRLIRLDLDGLILGGPDNIQLLATVDTSYYGNRDLTCQSGATFHLGSKTGAFSVMSKTPKIAVDSAMSSEGVGGHYGVRRVLPYRYFLDELQSIQIDPTPFYMDNLPFIQTIVGERGCSSLSKHILIRMKLLKQAYDAGEINILKLATTNMVADILTKPLGPQDYTRLRLVLQGYQSILLDPLILVP
jgi:hypothetical protein